MTSTILKTPVIQIKTLPGIAETYIWRFFLKILKIGVSVSRLLYCNRFSETSRDIKGFHLVLYNLFAGISDLSPSKQFFRRCY